VLDVALLAERESGTPGAARGGTGVQQLQHELRAATAPCLCCTLLIGTIERCSARCRYTLRLVRMPARLRRVPLGCRGEPSPHAYWRSSATRACSCSECGVASGAIHGTRRMAPTQPTCDFAAAQPRQRKLHAHVRQTRVATTAAACRYDVQWGAGGKRSASQAASQSDDEDGGSTRGKAAASQQQRRTRRAELKHLPCACQLPRRLSMAKLRRPYGARLRPSAH
jgi:hypothetical protein